MHPDHCKVAWMCFVDGPKYVYFFCYDASANTAPMLCEQFGDNNREDAIKTVLPELSIRQFLTLALLWRGGSTCTHLACLLWGFLAVMPRHDAAYLSALNVPDSFLLAACKGSFAKRTLILDLDETLVHTEFEVSSGIRPNMMEMLR
jgi:hypothetical protein